MILSDEKVDEWRRIDGLRYCISSGGQVCNSDGEILKSSTNNDGYRSIGIRINGKKTTLFIHALVAKAFIGPKPLGKQINHKDGVKTNNHPSNLEYLTSRENTQHAARMGLLPRGERNSHAKLTATQVLEIRRLRDSGIGLIHIGRQFGVSATQIAKIAKRLAWRHL